MTEETRKQIERDAYKYASGNADYFRQGATMQDPIADQRGYNRAVDDAIRSLKSKLGNSNSAGHGRVFLTEVFTELEKLKK